MAVSAEDVFVVFGEADGGDGAGEFGFADDGLGLRVP